MFLSVVILGRFTTETHAMALLRQGPTRRHHLHHSPGRSPIVPVREILNAVLRHDGRAFAIAHNHPSGAAEASDADRQVTASVRAAATTVGLRFLGHVVVANDRWNAVA
ncbi:JAB domain-containing protein [Mycobacterium avium]|nr:JAB domain-containing protein [Mycobacterium avium]MCG3243507.1 JAB domain-containing protein [Mycobacterium avium subsp. hominissuis]WOF19067.1 JAB domain-containing protein [Mycobacterium avium]